MLDPVISARINNTLACKSADSLPLADIIYGRAAKQFFAPAELDETKQTASACKTLGIDLTWEYGKAIDLKILSGGKWRFLPFSEQDAAKQITAYKNKKSAFEPNTLLAYFSEGLFSCLYDCLGLERLCLLLKNQPKTLHALMRQLTQNRLTQAMAFVQSFNEGVYFIADDLAGASGLIFSPTALKEFWVPGIKQVIDVLKKKDIKIIFHSDGDIWDLLPELMDMGVDAVHPLEPVGRMQPAAIRRFFGRQLILMGGVDIYNRAEDDILSRLKKNIAAVRRRGYFPGSSGGIGQGIAPGLIIEFYKKIKNV